MACRRRERYNPNMKLALPDEVREAAIQAPVEVQDEKTARRFYVISGEQFEKIRLLLEVEQVDRSLYEAGEIQLFADK